jgi:hypothetical protein
MQASAFVSLKRNKTVKLKPKLKIHADYKFAQAQNHFIF